MRLLLDTHVFLWTLDDSPRLSRRAREMMTAPGTECFVSAVSFWEIAIKASLRRAAFRTDVAKLVAGARAAGLKLLPFQPEHAVRVARLPRHHSDPFDRALVAQALFEPLALLTQDAALAPYGNIVSVV
ncbi:MAG: type II toxin-antitoxin system VapC family toxin [Betaproteobacteria bacterium]|nr:type II toxin-antitoxin system VapC family toxin [Betaproteobacteria bacterium]